MNVIDSSNNIENTKNRLTWWEKSSFKQCLCIGFPTLYALGYASKGIHT